MDQKGDDRFYHIFANGRDAREFIVCEEDYVFQFNRIAICSLKSGAKVIVFSLEETHPHIIVYGAKVRCVAFYKMYESATRHHISRTRGSLDNVVLDFSICEIKDADYLRVVACYVAVQSTKDGKPVMQYDYFWGTGSMYFRGLRHVPIWRVGEDGEILTVRKFRDLTSAEKRTICPHDMTLPAEWKICQGLILPENYVDVKMFESIYKTHNCFRVFSSAGRNAQQRVLDEMARVRGIAMEDIEARQKSEDLCYKMFHKGSARHLSQPQRIAFGRELRRLYGLSIRQVSMLARVPREELEEYL